MLLDDGNILSEKVGKTADSPAAVLAEMMKAKLAEASVLIGHVRFPSSEFINTAIFNEAAQPYVENFKPDLTIATVHNGEVGNYLELKEKLKGHAFESERIDLVDSEIIPHYFGEILNEVENVDDASYMLFSALRGSKHMGNAIAMLHTDDEDAFVHLVHKGKTRGLTVRTNSNNEVVLCSRPEPVLES